MFVPCLTSLTLPTVLLYETAFTMGMFTVCRVVKNSLLTTEQIEKQLQRKIQYDWHDGICLQ